MDKLKIIYYLIGFYLKRIKTRKQLSEFRKIKLQQLEKFLLRHSPYYSDQIAYNGGLLHLPIINKSEYFKNFNEINTVKVNYDQAMEIALKSEQSRDFSPMIGDIAVGLSSGTSGNRGLFITSANERARWVAAMIFKVIGWKWKKRNIAFFLRSNNQLYEQSNSGLIRFNFFDLSESFDTLLLRLNKLKPDILIAQPSVLVAVCKAINSGSVQIKPGKVISVAEVLESDVRMLLTKTFGQVIHEVYQCTEGFLACTCSEGKLHMNEDLVFFQERYLDEEMKRFHPIITDFSRKSQPMVRYELNDVLTYSDDKCACNSPFRIIEKIEGRADDVLIFEHKIHEEHVYVFGDFIRRVMLYADQEELIQNYQVHQISPDHLKISLNVKNNVEIIEAAILIHFNKYCTDNDLKMPEIEFDDIINFDPMKKFRRITRAPFHLTDKINYL